MNQIKATALLESSPCSLEGISYENLHYELLRVIENTKEKVEATQRPCLVGTAILHYRQTKFVKKR